MSLFKSSLTYTQPPYMTLIVCMRICSVDC